MQEKIKKLALLTAGWFVTSRCEPAAGRMLHLLLRLVWQQPQALAGWLYNAAIILLWKKVEVKWFHGAVIVEGAGLKGHSVSLGPFISLGESRKDREAQTGVGAGSYTFMHEYGHCRQSVLLGPLYLLVIGIPSVLNVDYPEVDANRRAARYFQKHHPGFCWNPEYYPKQTWRNRYSRI